MELLQRALTEALHRNAAETVRWKQYKEQHEGAKANLHEFQKSLEIDIMVPVGSKALMPGRLYHTNEVMVSHSGTYYSKCTAHKALEICQNRLNNAEKRLQALGSEEDMHRNKLELPMDFDAFSSKEIIETYDEEEEKRWRVNHKKNMKEHKQKEAEQRQRLMNGEEDDIIKRLEDLELMEELEDELEAVSEEDDETVQAILNGRVEVPSKKRISHFNEKNATYNNATDNNATDNNATDNNATDNNATSTVDVCIENTQEIDGLPSDSDGEDDDDDDIPIEFKEIETKAKSMSNKEKLKLYKAVLAEVQEYLRNCRPQNIQEISNKTDKMFLSDHLLSAIETIEDEVNCDQYLNGDSVFTEESDSDSLSSVVQPSVPPQNKPILKKNNSKNLPKRKISFALEDDVKLFDNREEQSKISTTVIFENGPVLHLNINHSDAKSCEASEESDVIRSPVDIYKQFADCTLKEPKKVQNSPHVMQKVASNNVSEAPSSHETKVAASGQDIAEAKTEVKEILDNIFGSKNPNEPDPLPEGSFVDAHQPKKRISLFKQRRQMKNQ